MTRAVRFDDLDALAEVKAAGFGPWGPQVVVDAELVAAYRAIAGAHPLDREVPGFLIASLLPRLAPPNDWRIEGHTSVINMGCPRIRFPAPTPIGARLRARSRIADVRAHARGTVVTLEFEVRAEDSGTDALDCTIELLYVGARA